MSVCFPPSFPLLHFPSPSLQPTLSPPQQGQSALMKAAHGGHDDMTQLLTANQAILDLKSKRGWTALMHAAHRGHEPVVRRLLLARADPSVMDRAGKTAVELAQDQDMRGVAGLLTTPTSSAATSSSVSVCYAHCSTAPRPAPGPL